MESKKIEFFDKLSSIILISTIFISLFFFIPFTPITLEVSKGFLISTGAFLSLFVWLLARLGEGKFSIPKDRLIIFGLMIPVFFLISSFFSSSPYSSFFGAGFEIGSFGSMLVLFIIFFLSSIHLQSEKRFWQFLGVIFAGAIILLVFELLNLFVGLGGLFPRFFQGMTTGNLVGSWNNFISFFGLVILLIIFTLEFLRLKRIFLWILYSVLVGSLFFLIILNVPLVWLIIFIFSVIIFVYSISLQHAGVKIINEEENKKRFPFISLIIIFISLFFLIGSNLVGGFVSKYVNIPNLDVRPSIVTTTEIAVKSLNKNPLFGSGPNTFSIDWSLWKPAEINETVFWNTDFLTGFSFLSTSLATVGVVGFLSLLFFIIILLIRGMQSVRIALRDPLSNYFIITNLIISLYSWIMIIIYNPNIIITAIAFSSSGMLIGILVYKNVIPNKEYTFLNRPKKSFFAILSLMVLMMTTLSLVYIYIAKFASVVYFSKSLDKQMTIESLSKSEEMLLNAIRLNENDIYYRNLSQVYLDEIKLIIQDENLSKDNLELVQQLVNSAENSAQNAININPKQYLNHLNMGNVYSSLSTLEIEGSYDKAVLSFDRAKELASTNPLVVLSRASLEFLNKNNSEAKKFIDEALSIKTNYTDAFFLLVEIEASEGNVSGAIKQAENATQKTQNDPTIFFRLGMLRYSNADYTGAIGSFERAVILDPTYLNARFFLGQSYQKVNRKDDALIQYNILASVLPDSQEVKDAISSISKTTPLNLELIKEKENTTTTPIDEENP